MSFWASAIVAASSGGKQKLAPSGSGAGSAGRPLSSASPASSSLGAVGVWSGVSPAELGAEVRRNHRRRIVERDAGAVRDAHHAPAGQHGQGQQGGHRLRAVDQRKPFLGLQRQRRKTGALEPLAGRQYFTVDPHLTLAEHRHG